MRLILALVIAFATAVVAAQDPPALSEVQRLRAEVHTLKAQVLEARYQLATCQAQQQARALAEERQQLEGEFRATVQAPVGATFDWQTLTFASPPSPPDPRPKP